MDLTVLGYYGGYPFKQNGTSAYLLQSDGFNLLLDCGSQALNNLQAVLDPLQLDAVILSHYHHDHTADLGVLQYYWQLNPGVKKHSELAIYGHTEDKYHFDELTLPGVTVGKPYFADQKLKIGTFEITFLKTIHPVVAYAMRIKESKTGKVLVFTSDTAYFDDLIDFSKSSNLLMTDTNFGANKTGKIWHMTSTQSGQLAKEAQVNHLLLTHLPQTLSLSELRQEAQNAAGSDVVVQVANRFLHLTV